jgi:hypothetical protein
MESLVLAKGEFSFLVNPADPDFRMLKVCTAPRRVHESCARFRHHRVSAASAASAPPTVAGRSSAAPPSRAIGQLVVLVEAEERHQTAIFRCGRSLASNCSAIASPVSGAASFPGSPSRRSELWFFVGSSASISSAAVRSTRSGVRRARRASSGEFESHSPYHLRSRSLAPE